LLLTLGRKRTQGFVKITAIRSEPVKSQRRNADAQTTNKGAWTALPDRQQWPQRRKARRGTR
jgi:hypothetical protein